MATLTGRAQSFAEFVAQAVSEVFSQALASPWSTEISSDDAALPAADSATGFALSISNSLQGTATLLLKNSDAVLLAQKFLSEPVDESSPLDPGRTEAVEELLRQVTGVAATKMKGLFGEVQFQVKVADSAASSGQTVVILASEGADRKLPVGLRLSEELVGSLSAQQDAKPSEVPVPAEAPAEDEQDHLDRVLGVRLRLSVRFGQRPLTLREILDLAAGAVVDLDRRVQDPVDLLLGDKVVARGDLVVVDGNYGIRVSEVPLNR